MTVVRHPRELDDVAGLPPASVSVGGTTYAVDRDGDEATVDLPQNAVESLARAYGVDPDALTVGETAETCTATVESTGEECGRTLPCPYHGGGDD